VVLVVCYIIKASFRRLLYIYIHICVCVRSLLIVKLFYVLFVCKCVLYYCHGVSIQLQLTNIYIYISVVYKSMQGDICQNILLNIHGTWNWYVKKLTSSSYLIICDMIKPICGNFKILIFEMWGYIKVDRTYPNISYRKLAAFINTETVGHFKFWRIEVVKVSNILGYLSVRIGN